MTSMSVPFCRNLVSRRAINLAYVRRAASSEADRSSPTIPRTGAAPVVPGLTLDPVSVGGDDHGHDAHAAGPRADLHAVPSWSSKPNVRSGVLRSMTHVNGMQFVPPLFLRC